MITAIEQETTDFDWFFTNGRDIGFAATGGGKLPDSVANSCNELELLANYFKTLPIISKAVINPNLKNSKPGEVITQNYISYFFEMAERGLFAFDKTFSYQFNEPTYHLVAFPSTPLKLNDSPPEIVKILTKTKANFEMGESLDISIFK